ncbi:MAG: T9SS type A sorting domain-containing protein [Bacteroidia bacterium]
MNRIFTLLLCITSAFTLSAQTLCDGQRFVSPVFADQVQETSNVKFGENIQPTLGNPNNVQELYLTFFDAPTDQATKRPLVILAFGGAFVFGARQSGDIVSLCTYLAEHGYATAAIDYRLTPGLLLGGNPREGTMAVLKATHDMKAAVRFFRADAAGANQFKIDTDHIFIGGVSAGAVASTHAAYLKSLADLPPYLEASDTVGIGGIEGLSGSQGFSSEVSGVINLCGAIGDTAWMEAGGAPLISMHGDEDGTVPYATDTVRLFGIDLPLSGSETMDIRAKNLGISSQFYTFTGADHVPFVSQITGQPVPTYMDTTERFVRDNLVKLVCGPATSIGRQELLTSRVYPQPMTDQVMIELPISTHALSLEVRDIQGRNMRIQAERQVNGFLLHRGTLSAGLYVFSIKNANNAIVSRGKIQIQ